MAILKVYGYDDVNILPAIPSASDDLQIPGNAIVDGNLTVSGTTTTVNSEIATADNFVHLNASYMTDAIKNGGFVFTVDPENNELNGNLNVASTTTILIGSDVTANFAANDIIQITDSEDPENDGLYQIHSSAFSSPNTTITIKDASTNVPSASVSGFVKNVLTTNADDDTMKIRVVKVGVLDTDSANGKFRVAFGSSSTMTYANLLTSADSITASSVAADDISAGDAAVLLTTSSGNITIDAAANDSDFIVKGTDGGADITMLTLDGSEDGLAIFKSSIKIKDSGNIGTTSTADALTLASNGDLTLKEDLNFADGKLLGSATTADLLTINANDVTVKNGKSIKVTQIDESGSGTGVTIDGVLLKDNDVVIADGGTVGCTSAPDAITVASTGIVSFIDDIKIKDGGTIGSASAPGALAISAGGDTTITGELDARGHIAMVANKGLGYHFTSDEAIDIGEVLYFKSNGKVALADADALSTSPVVAVALESAGSADQSILCNTMYGAIIDIKLVTTETFNRGVALYLDETAGRATKTAPTGGGDTVLRLGYAYEAGNGSLAEVQVIFAPEFIAVV